MLPQPNMNGKSTLLQSFHILLSPPIISVTQRKGIWQGKLEGPYGLWNLHCSKGALCLILKTRTVSFLLQLSELAVAKLKWKQPNRKELWKHWIGHANNGSPLETESAYKFMIFLSLKPCDLANGLGSRNNLPWIFPHQWIELPLTDCKGVSPIPTTPALLLAPGLVHTPCFGLSS